MQISQGLVNPNRARNSSIGKGKQVNIPVLFMYVRQRKSFCWHFRLDQHNFCYVKWHKSREYCNNENLIKAMNSVSYEAFGQDQESMKKQKG